MAAPTAFNSTGLRMLLLEVAPAAFRDVLEGAVGFRVTASPESFEASVGTRGLCGVPVGLGGLCGVPVGLGGFGGAVAGVVLPRRIVKAILCSVGLTDGALLPLCNGSTSDS
jgi:hypothetical protein